MFKIKITFLYFCTIKENNLKSVLRKFTLNRHYSYTFDAKAAFSKDQRKLNSKSNFILPTTNLLLVTFDKLRNNQKLKKVCRNMKVTP